MFALSKALTCCTAFWPMLASSTSSVSCGACVQACPTATLQEKTVIELGQPEHSVITTCAYCGVGCGFKAQMKGNQVVNMVPWKDGKANEGHSCVKGRFAWGYATHKDRITKPMIRAKITDPWREVSWDEAIGYAKQLVDGLPVADKAALERALALGVRTQQGTTVRLSEIVQVETLERDRVIYRKDGLPFAFVTGDGGGDQGDAKRRMHGEPRAS